MSHSLIYCEDTWPELGVTHHWKNVTSIQSMNTKRGIHVEMVERPNWGITCYMDNTIQSCEKDEKIYHEALVHPVMASFFARKRVMVVGGGEGAVIREVLKWPEVENVDMYEWDEDIVQLFKEKYPQWAKGAWNDPRLTIYHEDIFEAIKGVPEKKYDIIIIDLFDYTEKQKESWSTFFEHLSFWLYEAGSFVIYAGIRSVLSKVQPYTQLTDLIINSPLQISGIDKMFYPHSIYNREIIPYKVYIPSFQGEATFLLCKSRVSTITFESMKTISHITKDVWKSYKTFNW